MRTFLLTLIGVLLFISGCFSGSITLTWADPKYASTVAFWAMLGGWLSGLATFSAVVFSLYMAYRGAQNEIEKLKFDVNISDKLKFGDDWRLTVKIMSLRNMHTKVEHIYLNINGKVSFKVDNLVLDNPLPQVFVLKGESVNVEFVINSGVTWWPFFQSLEGHNITDFKCGSLVIETSMKTYEIKMNKNILEVIHSRFSAYKKIIH